MSPTRHFIAPEDAASPWFAGIDLGESQLKVGIIDDLGRPLSWFQTAIGPAQDLHALAPRIHQAVEEALRQAKVDAQRIVRTGLALPDALANRRAGPGSPLSERLSCPGGAPMTFASQAEAAAYGEHWLGAGRDFHSLVLFSLGPTIGCGIILGEQSLGGDLCGHHIIDMAEDARRCACGRRGHLAAYASAAALVERAQEALAAGRKSTLAERLAAGRELTPKLIAVEAELGDALAQELILDTATYLGIGAVNLMHTVDPHAILLGGTLTFGGPASAIGRRFLGRMREEVGRRAFALLAEKTTIDFAALGDDGGVLGAAGLARADYLKHAAA